MRALCLAMHQQPIRRALGSSMACFAHNCPLQSQQAPSGCDEIGFRLAHFHLAVAGCEPLRLCAFGV